MNSKVTIKVSKTQELEIPPEIKSQLQPDSKYEMTFNQDDIILKKIPTSVKEASSSLLRPRSGKSILRHAGTWKGEDFEECLQSVYDNRSEIEI